MKILSFLFLLISFLFIQSYSVLAENGDDDDFIVIGEEKKEEPLENYKGPLIDNGLQVLTNLYQNNMENLGPSLPLIQEIPQEVMDLTAYNKKSEKGLKSWFRSKISPSDSLRQEYLAKIITLSWAINEIAKSQGDLHESSSFTIVDPDHKIYNFLLGYVKLVTGSQNPAKLPWLLTTSNFAYRRDPHAIPIPGSSHHKDNTPESQFGIDIRFENYQTAYGLLPFGKRHILFGKLVIPGSNEDLLFIKFEELGIGGGWETIKHGKNLLAPKVKKDTTNSNREKDTKPEILEKYKELSGKEAPKGLKVYEMAEELLYHPELIETIQQSYPKDPDNSSTFRTGNEVILDFRPYAN